MPIPQEEVNSRGSALRASKFRFCDFEVDLLNRSLSRSGRVIRLQRKPFQILELLLQVRGQFVSRAMLTHYLWPDLNVNFDHNLNTAVNALRKALGDSPQNSCFIETRSGLGYRLIARVEEVVPVKSRVLNAKAYQNCVQARYFLNKLTQEDLHKSVAHFNAALAEDPDCWLANAGLAETYCLFAQLNMAAPSEAGPQATAFAMKAVEACPDRAEAHLALACVKRFFDWDWPGAEREFHSALDLDPDCAAVHQAYGSYLSSGGNNQRALQLVRRAQELDPASPVVNTDAAWVHYLSRDFAAAQEFCWKALVLEPRFAAAQHVLAMAYEQMGVYDEAIIEFENAMECGGEQPAVLAGLGHAYGKAGRHVEAAEAIEKLHQVSKRRHVSPYWHAILHAGAGQNQKAVEWLARARQNGDVWLVWVGAEPRFDGLREQPEFQAIVRQMYPAWP